MTAGCSGGATAVPRPGVEEVVAFTSAGLTSFLAKIGHSGLAELIGPLLATTTYVTADFCAADPPSDPGLTPSDLINVLDYTQPSVQIPAAAKFLQWFAAQYWPTICMCPTGTTPGPPTPSDPGTPGTDAKIPGSPSNANCWDNTITRLPNYASGAWNFNDVLPLDDSGCVDGPINRQLLPLPSPAYLQFKMQVGAEGANARPAQLFINFTTTNCSTSAGGSYTGPIVALGGSLTTPAIPVPSTARIAAVTVTPTSGSGTPTNNVTIEGIIYCQGQSPSALLTPCCPPDPNVDQKLNQLIGMVTAIYSIIPVRVPNYAAGTAHSGLSGTGSVGLGTRTIACRVTFDTLPRVYQVIAGVPLTYLRIGWVTPVTNQGQEAGMELTRDVQVLVLPEATSNLEYTFEPGASVTITELLAG